MSLPSKRRLPTEGWPFAAGLLITLLVAWFAGREFDWHTLQARLAGADLRYVALAAAAVLLNILLKAERWRWLFYPQSGAVSPGSSGDARPRRRDLLSALLIGQLGNALLPARLGDLARVTAVHRRAGVALGWCLLTLVAEKALDSVMLLALLGALLPSIAWRTWLSTTKLVSGLLLAAGLLALVGVATQQRVRQQVVEALRRWLPGPIAGRVDRTLELLSGWRVMQDRPVQFRLWVSSAALWLLAGLVNHFSFRAVGLQLPLTSGLLLAATEIAGTRLAYAPAAIGTFHSIAILTLASFGVGPTEALSAALLLHVIVYVPILIGGGAAVWWEGLARIP